MIKSKKLSLKLLKNILRRNIMGRKKKKAIAPKKEINVIDSIKNMHKIKQPDALAESYQEVDETMSKIDSIMGRAKVIIDRAKRIAKWK
jgi:hypothetical protein